ncbi:E3 ubiquitin-protein ligase TRIM71-like [Ptychodera flava]|uniref:E3 ubiquitin-protein ligase TRIM71-like n=1 Tax=Ptychodera flava TaxID=63121 RepID=UPI00396AAE31
MGCGSSKPVPAQPPTPPPPSPTPARVVPPEFECGFCKTKTSTGFCKDCGLLICQTCSRHHNDSAVLKKHDMIPLADYNRKRALLAKYVSPVVCSQHEGHEMTHYCKTCNVPMCVVCAEYLHKSHSHTTTLDALAQKHKALDEHVEAVRQKRQRMTDMSQSLLAVLESSMIGGSDLQGAVRSHTRTTVDSLRAVIEELQADGDRLIRELENDRQSKIRYLSLEEEEVRACIVDYDKHLREANELLEHSNDIGFLHVVDTTCGYLQTASAPGVRDTPEDSRVRFIPIEDAIEAAKKRKIGWLSTEKSGRPMKRESQNDRPQGKSSVPRQREDSNLKYI